MKRRRGPTRRQVLTGLGGITLTLPLLEKLSPVAYAQTLPGLPRRILVVAHEGGTVRSHSIPTGVGSSFTLPYITAPLAPFQDRCLFVSGLDNQVANLAQYSRFGHPAK